MIRSKLLPGAALAAAVLAAAPVHAAPDSWSGPDAHCVYSTTGPAWCSGTGAPADSGYTTTGNEYWPKGSG